VDLYAEASKKAAGDLVIKLRHLQESDARERSTKEFFRVLRAGLRQ
jgi:hypothetical protein